MSVCSRCGNELDFEASAREVYEQVYPLCDPCTQVLHYEEYEDNWWDIPTVDFTHADFIAVSEMDCG